MPQTGIVVTNTFAAQSGNVPASELDVNFSQPISALNSLLTFGNYFVDSGSAGSIVLTVPSPLVASLVAGLPFQVKIAAENTGTGASTVSINSGPATPVIYPNGGAILPNQFDDGGIVQLMYDGTNFQYLGSVFGSGTFTAALTGVSGASGTAIWSISNNIATINLPAISSTSNSTSMSITGLPSYLQTVTTTYQSPAMIAVDNGTPFYTAMLNIFPASGTIQAWKTASGPSSWTPSGTKGFGSNLTLVYLLT